MKLRTDEVSFIVYAKNGEVHIEAMNALDDQVLFDIAFTDTEHAQNLKDDLEAEISHAEEQYNRS